MYCRAIGDVALQPYVTCEPEIVVKQIEADDEYVVLASDGIYDVISNEELGKLVVSGARDFLNIAKTICTEAILLGSTDNVTVLVIDLKRRYSHSVQSVGRK
jgi:serine/threonine protein phosphatase PrpC